MIGLDTNVLVRYIAQDDPKQKVLASRLIDKECTVENPGYIGTVTLVELVWVSESCYGASKTEIVELLQNLLSVKQLIVQDSEIVWNALRAFKNGPADFADYLVERTANSAGCDLTYTFDKKASKAGMKLLTE